MCLGLCDCRYFASQGFYVVVDYQTMKGGPEDNIFDKESWMSQWVDLVTQLVQYAPETHGRLLLDLINEPDGCAFPLLSGFLGTPSHVGFLVPLLLHLVFLLPTALLSQTQDAD